jgi:proteasome-associated ATPase
MDKQQVRACLESAFAANDKTALRSLANGRFLGAIMEVLWDLRGEAGGGPSPDTAALRQLSERIEAARKQPGVRGRCLEVLPDKRRALVRFGGVREEVTIAPNLETTDLKAGTEVLIQGTQTGGRTIVDVRTDTGCDGVVATIAETLDDRRVVVEDGGAKIVAQVADGVECVVGGSVRYDPVAHLVLEALEDGGIADLQLERPPRYTFDDIGGLVEQKLQLRERLIYPVTHRKTFQKYGLEVAKGALLHGPPGCGKTMLASAVFNEMRLLREDTVATEGFFVISGPECLSEWAGRTERTIREVFRKARTTADRIGLPSVVFWDELESLAGTRRDSPTYMPEKTVVPTLLAELQGLEEHAGVVFLAATNRPDLVDPALLRPGRLGDVIVSVPRPDKAAGSEILAGHFRRELPAALSMLVDHGLCGKILAHIYDTDRPLATMRGAGNETVGVVRRDLASGALLAQIAKELILSACLSEICGKRGPTLEDGLVVADRLMVAQILAQTSDSGGALPVRRLQTGGLSG